MDNTYFEDYPRNFTELDVAMTRDMYDIIDPSVKGFDDQDYRRFRRKCQFVTRKYRLGKRIPSICYPESQKLTWAKTFNRLMELYPTHACSKFNRLLAPFLQACNITAEDVPDMDRVSNYVKRKTGFRIRPVSTFTTPRDFLGSLAFRVFGSSQFVRHNDAAFFSNEPDIIHDIIGHTVLLCDPEFAQFSQEVGLASLAAPDHIVTKIASVYMSTVESGLCREGNEIRAYGALLLSSANELEHVFTDKAVKRPLEMVAASSSTTIDLNKYQDVYYVSGSIEQAIQMARSYVNALPSGLSLTFNPDTNCIEEQQQEMIGILKKEQNISHHNIL